MATVNDPRFGDPQPQRGWIRRNLIWLIPVGGLGSIALCAGCCGGVMLLAFGALRSSDAYQQGLAKACADPRVIAELGAPVEAASYFPSGNISIHNNQGDAKLDFSVAGPRGEASVHVEATMAGGAWTLNKAIARTVTEKEIDLLADDDSESSEN